jgi:PAS domain S-box-containing protein
VISLTPDGRISSWNPASEWLFGFREAEAIGQSQMIFVPPSRVTEAEQLAARMRDGETVKGFETSRRRKNGSEFPVLLSVAPILSASGHILGYSEILTDVTDRKREEEMRESRDIAIESAKLRSQFLANTSHEIRTPLNPILGMAQLLLLTNLDARQREYVETIWSSGDLLLSIVHQILEFSKLSAGKLAIENIDFDLAAAAEASVESLAERARPLELALAIDPDVPQNLRGDPNRLRQVLTNLIGNAIKFTEQGEVVVSIRTESRSDGEIVLAFSVADTGIGISEDSQRKLFQPFIQADGSTARKYGGTGLGLAICRELVERMGGSIGVESTPGNGSLFHFTARFGISDEQARPFDAKRLGLIGKRVLVVDDNASYRVILAHQISAWNIEGTHVGSGVEALTMMREAVAAGRPFHAALIDMHMPGMNGRALAHAIRSTNRLSATPLVILGSTTTDSTDGPIAREVDAWMVKPFKREHLFATLCKLLADQSPDAGYANSHQVASIEAVINRAPAVPRAINPARILLVEDDHVNQKVALNQLEHLGYGVRVVDGGKAALEELDQSRYDLILMDCQMPSMDGYQTAKLIRLGEGRQHYTPIIAMTAHAMEGDRDKCLAAGMDDYISKPVDLTVLGNKLAKWLQPTHPEPAREVRADAPSPEELTSGIDTAIIDDLREISKKCGRDVLRQAVDIFATEAPLRIADIRAAISAHDTARLAEIAHKLKGASLCVGAARVGMLCGEIESHARDGGHHVQELLPEVVKEVSSAIEKLLASVNSTNPDVQSIDTALQF